MEQIDQFLSEAMANDFFAGGIALGAIGVVATLLRGLLYAISRLCARRAWVSLTLDNVSPDYRYIYVWLEHSKVLSHARHLRRTDERWVRGTSGYAASPGTHWFFWRGRICRLEREVNEKSKVGASYQQRTMDKLRIEILFGRLDTIMGWIETGRQLVQTKDRIGPSFHVLKSGEWDHLGDVPRRSLQTVLVDDDRVEKICEDMRWFYQASEWYASRGVPWRRGYLLYGPPGTGKSSLIRALASELSLDIAALDVGQALLTDDALRQAMMDTPKNSLIAIEDVDAVFTHRKGGKKQTGVSFSGLLNAIDGVGAQEGRALIMTTNHIEKLDPALIRPGRADIHTELGLISAATSRRLFERFFPGEDALASLFEQQLGAQRYSPAKVQGWLLAHCSDALTAARAEGVGPPARDIAAE